MVHSKCDNTSWFGDADDMVLLLLSSQLFNGSSEMFIIIIARVSEKLSYMLVSQL